MLSAPSCLISLLTQRAYSRGFFLPLWGEDTCKPLLLLGSKGASCCPGSEHSQPRRLPGCRGVAEDSTAGDTAERAAAPLNVTVAKLFTQPIVHC